MLSDDDITRIGRRIVEGYGPLVVGVFGSYGMGTAHAKSDLDIFVIKRTSEQPPARTRSVLRCLVGVLHPLDIHVFTPEEIDEEAPKELSFVWLIVRQARILHPTAEEAARLVPSLAANGTSRGPIDGLGGAADSVLAALSGGAVAKRPT